MPGEGRGCQAIIWATRSITAMARGSVSPRRRNAMESMPAAAASSSVKLSTAKALPILPGARRFERRRRSLGIPAVLIVAHPLHAHRLANGFRQQHGIGRDIVIAITTVRTGA